MSMYALYPSLIRPLLFCLDPENAHSLTINTGHLLSKPPLTKIFGQHVVSKPVEIMGLKFDNPLGLAAGMDKNGDAIDFLGALGFGHLELGTVTPLAQEGNARPRMFRVKVARGLINRMGFNNKGVDYLVKNLQQRHYQGVIGVSIGKNEITPIEKAANDYLHCMNKVYNYADYIAVNISCPNTKDLTALQEAGPLVALLSTLKQEQGKLASANNKYVPLVVKIAPDLDDVQLEAICDACLKLKIDGMTCTNTTTSRDEIYGLPHASEWGGLSGQPLRHKSNMVLQKVASHLKGQIPIIGVGGVDGIMAAREKMQAGASLVQVYSAFVYQGPSLIQDIVNNLQKGKNCHCVLFQPNVYDFCMSIRLVNFLANNYNFAFV